MIDDDDDDNDDGRGHYWNYCSDAKFLPCTLNHTNLTLALKYNH